MQQLADGLRDTANGLLAGAIETTSQAVAQVVQYLLDHPEWLGHVGYVPASGKAAARV